jgi:phospholipase/carboxylesterase
VTAGSYVDRTALVDAGPALSVAGLLHRVRQPALAGPHPTVVMLHGLGGDDSAMWLFWPALPRGWLAVAPRACLVDPGGGYSWRPHERGDWPGLGAFDESVAALRRLIGALPELYAADADEVYLLGFSQGAALSFAIAIQHPGLVRGVAAIVGFVPTDCTPAQLSTLERVPVFMTVGRRDPLIPAVRSRTCADALRAAHVDLDYHEYDVGHKLTSSGMRDLRAWFEHHHAHA